MGASGELSLKKTCNRLEPRRTQPKSEKNPPKATTPSGTDVGPFISGTSEADKMAASLSDNNSR